jgi:predicted ATPase
VKAPLIGRAAELAQIEAVVATAAGGRGRVLLLDGEAGIGKTRLVEQALDLAAGAGMPSFVARCDELESRRPFGAIAACLGVSARRTEPRHRHVARLLFEGPAPEAHLVEALVALVEEACEAGPLAIALDDLHWADPSTLLVLHRLVAAVDQLPLLVCGAYRPAPRPPELARLLRGAAARQATTLSLAPLVAGDVQALLSSVLGTAAGPRLSHQVALAGGNPFYVTEMVAALRASGALETTPAGAEIPSVALPPALMFTVLLELCFLPEQVQDMLRAAAVLGSGFAVQTSAWSSASPRWSSGR